MQIHLHLRCARGIARMDAILIVPKRFGKTPWLKLSGTATGRRLEFVELDSSAHKGLTVRQRKASARSKGCGMPFPKESQEAGSPA